MRNSPVLALAGWELRTGLRSRWAQVTSLLFVAACAATAFSGLRTFRELGLPGIGAAIDGLVAVAVLLPPMLALVLGANAIAAARERGLLAMLASQPLRRHTLVVGAFLGVSAAVSLGVVAGLGAAAVLVSGVTDGAGLASMLTLLAAALGMTASAAAVGVAVSTLVTDRLHATAVAVGIWFVFALGIDLVVAVVAPSLRLGPQALLAAVAVNPLEAGRLLTLLVSSPSPEVLGPFGSYLADRAGLGGAVAVLAGVLVAWVVLPLGAASALMHRRDI
jgi:ABC-type transport system involved in multi-copper enzyme maturation permease subunit